MFTEQMSVHLGVRGTQFIACHAYYFHTRMKTTMLNHTYRQPLPDNLLCTPPQTISSAHLPQTISSEHLTHTTSSTHHPQTTSSAHHPQTTSSTHPPLTTSSAHPPQTTSSAHPPQTTSSEHLPLTISSICFAFEDCMASSSPSTPI